MINKNSITYTIGFAFIISFILVIPLSLAHLLTKPTVAQNQKLAASATILAAFGLAIPPSSQEILADYGALERLSFDGSAWIPDNTSPAEAPLLLYRYQSPQGPLYGRFYSGAGLWGTITVALTFSTDGQTLHGAKVYSQVETPGLGSRIEELWFLSQLQGQNINGPLSLNAIASPGGDLDKSDLHIDGISGATRSSEAFVGIINQGATDMQQIIRKGGL
jgi:Na+-transporting NADH:ubiquinone oxidoreductase subunit NqrC